MTVNKKLELENNDFSQLRNSIHLIPSTNDAYGMPGCPRKMFLQNTKFCVWESRKGEVLNVWKPVILQVLESLLWHRQDHHSQESQNEFRKIFFTERCRCRYDTLQQTNPTSSRMQDVR